MSEKLILKENFGEYKGHIITDFKNTPYILNLFFNNHGNHRLCNLTIENIGKCKVDSEIFFLNINELKKEISSLKCEKCIETYDVILNIIEEEKKITPTQKLLLSIGTHILSIDSYMAESMAELKKKNRKCIKAFNKSNIERKISFENKSREERLYNKLIKTKK